MNRDLEEIVRHITILEQRLDDLVKPEIGAPVSTADVSDPPNDAEIRAIWPDAFYRCSLFKIFKTGH